MMNATKMHVEHKAALFPKYSMAKNDANFKTQTKSCVHTKVERQVKQRKNIQPPEKSKQKIILPN